MRLSIVNYSSRRIGGTEQNLDVILPELERRGHSLQFVYFHDQPIARAAIRTGPNTQAVHVPEEGEAAALASIKAFQPDVINVHGEIDPAFQSALLPMAPSVYSVHNYYGTCISGLKSHAFPIIQPCSRVFGPACLVHYLPRRCGGRNPGTMIRRYARERHRLQVMAGYDAIVTHSRHMQIEYGRHGLAPDRIHGLPYEVTGRESDAPPLSGRPPVEDLARLLYVGRMEKRKGGQVLIAALPQVQNALRRPVELHFAGDGPECASWQALASRLTSEHPSIRIHFHGWLAGEELQELFSSTHLLVVPSLWPEPFGKVGPEAATHGVPVATFAVGGITEWLLPGINGMAAPGDPPRAEGLAQAIASCLRDPAVHARLSAGALATITRFNLKVHVDALINLFERVCRERNQRLSGVLVP